MIICDASETTIVRTFDITEKNYNFPHIICILPVEDAGGIVIATIFCLLRLIYDAIAASSRLFLM